MWSKLSSALKHRPSTPSLAGGDDDLSPSKADVLAGVYEQHPNLSVFHPEPPSDVPFPPSSPVLSPVMNGRKSIFKKPGKPHPPPINTQTSESGSSSPLVSPLMLPKKVKSSLNLASGECLAILLRSTSSLVSVTPRMLLLGTCCRCHLPRVQRSGSVASLRRAVAVVAV